MRRKDSGPSTAYPVRAEVGGCRERCWQCDYLRGTATVSIGAGPLAAL